MHDLALRARVPTSRQQREQAAGRETIWKEDNHEFDSSPIQQLYFQLVAENTGTASTPQKQAMHFNQSVLLQVSTSNKNIAPHDLSRGLHALVETHSMLRARFRRDGSGRSWRQRITTDTNSSYRFKTHTVTSKEKMGKKIEASQKAIDVQKGPLLVADWFNLKRYELLVSVVVR